MGAEVAYMKSAGDIVDPVWNRLINVEAEGALLGAMMIEPSVIDPILDRLTPAEFYLPVHGRMFSAIQREHGLGRHVTPVLLKPYFEGDEELAAVGGVGYLARLSGTSAGLFSTRDICEQIADLAQRRKLYLALREALQDCGDPERDLTAICGTVDAAIDTRGGENMVESDAAETMAAFQAELDAEHFGVTNGRIEGIDHVLGALEPKSMTVLAARPGMGKTAVATNYALGAARNGHGVAFYSLEMSREQLGGRMIADVGFDSPDRRIGYTDIQKRTLNPWQRERVNEISKLIGRLPMHVIDTAGLKLSRLERSVRSQKRKFAAKGVKLELVVIDYLQLLLCDVPKRSVYEAISEISTRLKALAKNNDVAVLALAQLSRNVEQRPDKRPILADLRDSGQIEQDADAVLFLMREEYYLNQSEPQNDPDAHATWEDRINRCRGVIDFICAKRRNGTTGTAHGRFYGAYQAVR